MVLRYALKLLETKMRLIRISEDEHLHLFKILSTINSKLYVFTLLNYQILCNFYVQHQ